MNTSPHLSTNAIRAATLFLALSSETFVVAAEDVDGESFRTVDEGSWYHPVEPDRWVYLGGKNKVIVETLARIRDADGERRVPGQPDTIIASGPGNWTHEFVAAGDTASHRARSTDDEATRLAAWREAIAYYHTAAAPHTNAADNVRALDLGEDAYAQAAALLSSSFRRVDIDHADATFEAFLHLPAGDGPHPVLVMSNGSDMAKIALFSYYENHLSPKRIGMLSIDLPGMGGSRDYDLADGASEKLHVAALEWAKRQPDIDSDALFVQGVSFGGHAAARTFLGHPELDLAGAIYVCGPLDQAFLAPPEAYAHFPEFTIDGVETRLGLDNDVDVESLAAHMRVLSLDAQGLFDGEPVDTPLLAINTNADPVAPLADMERMIARATNVEKVVFDMPGHCPPPDEREEIVSAWIAKRVGR